MGKAPASSHLVNNVVSMNCTIDPNRALTRFWETEKPPRHPIPDPEEVQYEKHFILNHELAYLNSSQHPEASRVLLQNKFRRYIARLYDPCGFLTPVTFYAKQIMQRFWSIDCGWDEVLPSNIKILWLNFISEFNQLYRISILRWVLADQPMDCQLHGFSDASERGYAACVYLRVEGACGSTTVRLLSAKSRVAPIKQKLTVPKLELSGPQLLARFLEHVFGKQQGKIKISSTMAWSDSSIVLAWLKTSPHKLQTYEGNRVSQIQALIPSATWKHVLSALNPADSVSRGLTPSELVKHSLRWSPPWLGADASTWPGDIPFVSEGDLPGIRVPPALSHVAELDKELPTLTKFSLLSKLQSVVAWCKRFAWNSRNPTQRRIGPLSIPELSESLFHIAKLVQSTEFASAIALLGGDKPLGGSIRRLNPFLDLQGLIRVGDRLVKSASALDYGTKHPLLLPKSHHVTKFIIGHYHRLFLHPGLMASINLYQSKLRLLSALRFICQQIFRCQRCYRLRLISIEPFMGDPPSHRVTACRPFQKVGVDFAGPFMLKISRIRKARSFKSYSYVFVCFTTNCVHLEIVSELSTEDFLACLDRFVSNRGLPTDVFSDCGTNFVGARNYLKIIRQITQHFWKRWQTEYMPF